MASSPRIDELRKKFEENPRRYFAPLANEYRKAGEVAQAIAICREYLPQQPGHMSGHIVYGQALYEARQFDEAKTVFETALSLDPENLIALRHLGDIALIIGDAESAKTWYRRVLEADPRNEEIQSQLTKLDQGIVAPPASAPTPIVNVAVPAAHPSKVPTPSSTPTVVISAMKPPVAQPPAQPPAPSSPSATSASPPSTARPVVTAESPTAEIRLDEVSGPAAIVASPTPPERSAPPAPAAAATGGTDAIQLEPTVSGATSADAPPLDGFSLDGLETTSLAQNEPQSGPPPSQAMPQAATPAAAPNLDFAVAGADVPEQPSATSLPDLELSAPATPATPVSDAPPIADLELTIPSVPETGTTPPLARLAESPASRAPAVPPPMASPALDLGELSLSPVAEDRPVPPDAGPFITETMAELYLQQGHREEALRVYRALLEQRPQDHSLSGKIAAIEADMRPAPPVIAHAPAAHPSARSQSSSPASGHAGPTIREVLNVVALRRPGAPGATRPQHNGSSPEQTQHNGVLADDVIGRLFGSSAVSDYDERCARNLAYAFSAQGRASKRPDADQVAGSPAHPASNELSLDTVFGGETAAPAAPSSFSFDQFFSQRAAANAGSGPATGESGSAASSDEVAQFSQWLDGLKQR